MVTRCLLFLLSSVVLVACGDDASMGPADGGDGGGGDGGVVSPAAPEIPWLDDGAPAIAAPVLGPCPEGWTTLDGAEGETCAPYPESGPDSCADGSMHFPGDAGCEPIGVVCPAGPFADGLAADGSVVYVQEGAAPGGDGSLATPFATLSEVPVGTLDSGQTVALSKGTHPGSLVIPAGVTVRGACAPETLLSGRTGSLNPVLTVIEAGDAAVVRDLSVVGAPQPGIDVSGAGRVIELRGVILDAVVERGVKISNGAELVARDVLIRRMATATSFSAIALDLSSCVATIDRLIVEGSRFQGVRVATGADVTMQDVVIRGTLPQGDGTGGYGVVVQDDAELTINRGLLRDNTAIGLLSVLGATAHLQHVVVADTAARPTDRMQGVGIVAAQGGAVEARQVLLERNTEASIRVENVGSSMVIADGIVRDTQSRAEDVGRGVLVRDEGRFEGSRLVVARSRAGGVLVESATATLADVVVRDVESTGDGSEGFGLVTNGESTITADRLLIERARNIGVRIDGPVDVRLSDLAVEDTEPAAAAGAGGHGLAVYGGANVQLSRALVAGCAMAGINVGAATLHAEDVVVRDMVPSNLDPPASHGLVVQTEGRVDMTRARFERCIGTGVLVINERGSLDFSDLAIMETASIPGTGTHGHGMHVQGTGTVTGQRLSVTESRGGGVMALLGASIDVQDVVVADTAYPACRETWCEAMGTAYGLTSVDASVRVSRFSVARSALCGVFVGGDVDLAEGAVSEGVIGACVQVDDYDIDRLNSDVVYQDNESNLDVTSLPVPSTF